MKQSKLLNVILAVSGLISGVVGVGMLFFPVEFHASAGIVLGDNINLNNEMRAAGGPLLVGGLIIASGAVFERMRFVATVLSGVIYLSYGGARLISFSVDGLPSVALIQITAIEVLIGAISVMALFFYSDRKVFAHA